MMNNLESYIKPLTAVTFPDNFVRPMQRQMLAYRYRRSVGGVHDSICNRTNVERVQLG